MNVNKTFDLNDESYDLLVITPIKFSRYLKRLANHKINYGVNTKIVRLDDIYKGTYFKKKGRDKPERIKYFIKDAIEKWKIKYVMLVGDVRQIPIRSTHMWDGRFITDLYYADIYNKDGSFSSWDTNNNGLFGEYHHNGKTDFIDLHPDVGIGRLACRNLIEVRNTVNKIINYEKRTYGKEWFNKIILCGGDAVSRQDTIYDKWWNWSGHGGSEGEYINELIMEKMPNFKPVKLWASQETLSPLSILSELNKGAGFVHFSGHGGAIKWYIQPEENSTSFMYPLNYLLFNKHKLPIVFFGGCNLGRLDYSIKGISFPCLAWQFVVKRYGGAIASIASSRSSFGGVFQGGESSLGLYFFRAYNDSKIVTLSQMFMKAQNDYINDFGDRMILQEYNLLGDPSLRVGGYPSLEKGD